MARLNRWVVGAGRTIGQHVEVPDRNQRVSSRAKVSRAKVWRVGFRRPGVKGFCALTFGDAVTNVAVWVEEGSDRTAHRWTAQCDTLLVRPA
jgi:hypothetical protein